MQEAQDALTKIADLARKEQNVLESGDAEAILAVDKEVELAIGEKERAIGAYQHHIKTHGC